MMKVRANYKGYGFDRDGNVEITFTVDRYYLSVINELDQAEPIEYELSLKKKSGSRTERQNRATWKLITMIIEKQDGIATESSVNELYIKMIVEAQIRVDYFEVLEVALPTLQQAFRVVKLIEKRISNKGTETVMVAVYRGLSMFDKEENNRFIEVLLNYAGKHDLDITLESEELRSLLR